MNVSAHLIETILSRWSDRTLIESPDSSLSFSMFFEKASLLSEKLETEPGDRVFQRSKEQQEIVNDRFELSKKSRSLSKQALKRWFTDDYINKNPNIYEKICSMLEENDMENFLKVYELFVKHQDNEIFENIKTKTLVMTGENDIGSTPEMSQNLSKKIANSKVKIISNGKHLCSIECADDVNNAIKEHIKND